MENIAVSGNDKELIIITLETSVNTVFEKLSHDTAGYKSEYFNNQVVLTRLFILNIEIYLGHVFMPLFSSTRASNLWLL